MAARTLHQLGDPPPWRASEPVDGPRAPAARQLIEDLADAPAPFRAANGFGRGVGAPQTGELPRYA